MDLARMPVRKTDLLVGRPAQQIHRETKPTPHNHGVGEEGRSINTNSITTQRIICLPRTGLQLITGQLMDGQIKVSGVDVGGG